MLYYLVYSFGGLLLLWMVLLSLGVRRMWLSVVFFGLEATLAYTIVGNLVPQIESRPQAELQLSPDATPEQLVAAGEGTTDCAATVLGLLFGAALAHSLGFAASAKGVPPSAQAAVIFGFLVVFLISVLNSNLFTIFAKKKGDLDVQGN